MTETADFVFRDYNTPGVPASGPYEPEKPLIRRWGKDLEDAISAYQANGGLIYDTRANLYADLDHGANSSAWVIADSIPAYIGIYRKAGASGSGSWSRVGDLPYSFIVMADAGAGTANAIVATSSMPAPTSSFAALFILSPFEGNTGAVTLSLNGAASKPVVSVVGSALPAGALVADMAMLLVDDGANWRLLTDYASAANLAAAVAVADLAAAAATAAQGYAATALGTTDRARFGTVASLLDDDGTLIDYTGSGAALEVAAGAYVEVVNGQYVYEVAADDATDHHVETAGGVRLYVRAPQAMPAAAFGMSPAASAAVNASAWQAAIDAATLLEIGVLLPAGVIEYDTTPVWNGRIMLAGAGKYSTLMIYTGTGDGFHAVPALGKGHAQYIRDFAIIPEVPEDGAWGIHIELEENCFWASANISHLWIGQFGNGGLLLDNTIDNVNGFFTTTIHDNLVYNGVKVINGGDTLSFLDNVVTGYGIGFDVTIVGGARQLTIERCNITTNAEHVKLVGVNAALVHNNWCEIPPALGDFAGTDGALVVLEDCTQCVVTKTVMQPFGYPPVAYPSLIGANYCVRVLGTSNFNFIDHNQVHVGYSGAHIAIAAGNANTIGRNNVSGDLPVVAVHDAVPYQTYNFIYDPAASTEVPTASSGTLTTASSSLFSEKIGRRVRVTGVVVVTDAGTGAGELLVEVPHESDFGGVGIGVEYGATGVLCVVRIEPSENMLRILEADATTVIASGRTIRVDITYNTAA